MDISLNGYENFIKEQMATGLYNSVNDIVQEAMSLLKLRKSISQERIDAFNAEIPLVGLVLAESLYHSTPSIVRTNSNL